MWTNPRVCVGAKSSLRRKGPMTDPPSSRYFRPVSYGRKFLLISALKFVQSHNKLYRCVEGWWAITLMANDRGLRLNALQGAAQNSRKFAGAEEKLQTFKSFSSSAGRWFGDWVEFKLQLFWRRTGLRQDILNGEAVWKGNIMKKQGIGDRLGPDSTVWIEVQFEEETQRKKTRYFQVFCYFINTIILATCGVSCFLPASFRVFEVCVFLLVKTVSSKTWTLWTK